MLIVFLYQICIKRFVWPSDWRAFQYITNMAGKQLHFHRNPLRKYKAKENDSAHYQYRLVSSNNWDDSCSSLDFYYNYMTQSPTLLLSCFITSPPCQIHYLDWPWIWNFNNNNNLKNALARIASHANSEDPIIVQKASGIKLLCSCFSHTHPNHTEIWGSASSIHLFFFLFITSPQNLEFIITAKHGLSQAGRKNVIF